MKAEQRTGFICIHVAETCASVCLVEHSAPLDGLDSGWGLYCGAAEHPDEELRITDLENFKDLDPDLSYLLNSIPEGHIAWRESKNAPWKIEAVPEDDTE